MAKKSKKKRKKSKNVPAGQSTTASALQTFKNHWNSGNWSASLHAYRGWANRTGKKREPLIEGELLFRCASGDFKEKNHERALHRLEEARQMDPANSTRYDRFKAVCLAKNNRLKESSELFSHLEDHFHCFLLSAFLKFEKTLPHTLFNDPAAARSDIAAFCRDFLEANGGETMIKHPALKNIHKAFVLFTKGEDPEPQLKLLMKKQEFETLAVHLLLIAHIFKKSTIKLRNIIKGFASYLKEDYFQDIIAALLATLLNEEKYKEVRQLDRILTENGIRVKGIEKIRDELYFRLGLAAVKANKFDTALDYFEEIEETTSAVLHNMALCNQTLERYSEANDYWTRLLGREKKPGKSSSSEATAAYCTILKYIGHNFLHDDDPGEAQKYFKEVLRFDKKDKEALDSLMTISFGAGSHHDVLSYAGQLHQIDPANEEYFITYLLELKYFGNADMMISLCKEALEKKPGSKLLIEILVDGYTEKAWQLRDKDPYESIRLIKDAGRFKIDNGKLIFLQGYIQYKDGKKKGAVQKFRQAAKAARGHLEEFQIGTGLYEIGLKNEAVRLFKKIGVCVCDLSAELYTKAITFLAGHDDYEYTIRLCDYGVKKDLYWLMDIADVLYDAKKFPWAKEYSTRAMEEEEVGDEEKYFHLVILNKTGDKDELLDWALRLQSEAEEQNHLPGIAFYSHIVTEVKSRGRFRLP
jgi:tetratricopeptide (TPR) repeat protein